MKLSSSPNRKSSWPCWECLGMKYAWCFCISEETHTVRFDYTIIFCLFQCCAGLDTCIKHRYLFLQCQASHLKLYFAYMQGCVAFTVLWPSFLPYSILRSKFPLYIYQRHYHLAYWDANTIKLQKKNYYHIEASYFILYNYYVFNWNTFYI